MRYLALAADYDGTLATHGRVDEPTLAAIGRLRGSGRHLILVTGRELDELLEVFPQVHLCERVVAENGALLYRPATREERRLAEPPPPEFVAELGRRGVGPISVGRTIVATWEPHETTVLEVIRELGLELHVIFNKGAVMVLPSGVNKATGLAVALEELGLSPHNVVGVGDAENDHAFLSYCECGVAVANALPSVKERADWVAPSTHGAGVTELIDALDAEDLAAVEPRLTRHHIRLGRAEDGREVALAPYGLNVMVAGSSGSGKSTITAGLLERLKEKAYQFCVIDPEGDYSELEGAVVLGDPDRVPATEEVFDVLDTAHQDVVVNLLGLALEHRPGAFEGLLPRLQEHRARAGRPHWIVVDEAHHLLPSSWDPATLTLPRELNGLLLITVHPESVAPAVLATVDRLVVVGESPRETVRGFCRALGRPEPEVGPAALEPGEALVWAPRSGEAPLRVRTDPPAGERRRHGRKYAEGSVGEDRSFVFRGPEGKLRLRAQNLVTFLRMADGVDDATWLYHLGRGDYSRWFRDEIKDEGLAAEIEPLERAEGPDPAESRARVRRAIERRYTLPAEAPSGDVSAQ